MRSASFAEWIIARFTTKACAASIIGDLLEAVPEKGKLWFWLSVTRVFFSLTWRRPLAYVVAIATVLCWVRAYPFTVFGRPSVHMLSQQWMGTYLYLYVFRASTFLSVGLAYTAILYGHKDPFVRRIAAVWILFESMIFFGTTQSVAVICCVLSACAVAYSFSFASGRKGLFALATTAALLIGWYALGIPLLAMLFNGPRAGWHVLLTHSGPYLGGTVFQLAGLFLLTLIYSWVHHMFFENSSREGEPTASLKLLEGTNA